MKAYGRGLLMLVGGWFLAVLAASALGIFRNGAQRFGIQVAVAALIPILVFGVWFARSPRLRAFTFTLNPQVLTMIQSFRVLGFSFVLLEAHGALPAIFAWPAGYGDMAIGMTACLVAWKIARPAHRNLFLLWEGLGIADLVTAVSLGATAPLLRPHGASMGPMTSLPLSLVPTFFVPLYLILHVICIAQARRWNSETAAPWPTEAWGQTAR
jgi:hypothetical protein